MSDAAAGVIDSAKSGLKGKVGPVPVWLIAGGLGVTAVGGYYLYQRRAIAASDSATPTSTPADGSYATTGNTVNTTLADAQATTAPQTNATWIASATLAVRDSSGASAIDISAALLKYLSGSTISPAEKQFVDMAITAKGYPPDGVNGISDIVDPAVEAQKAAAAAQAERDAQAAQDARERAAAEAENSRQIALAQAQAAAQAQASAAAAERDRAAQAAAQAQAAAIQAQADAAARAQAAASATQVQQVNTQAAPAAAPAPKPVSYTIFTTPIGQTYNLQALKAGYRTASDAHNRKDKIGNVNPGSYTIMGRQTISGDTVVNVRLNGQSGSYWINPS